MQNDLLKRARDVLEGQGNREIELKSILKLVAPQRKKLKNSVGSRIPLNEASADELYHTIEAEINSRSSLVLRAEDSAYKAMERRFCGQLPYDEQGNFVTCVKSACLAGAIDLHNASVMSLDELNQYGVVRLSSADPLKSDASFPEGIYTLSMHPGCYIIPKAISKSEQERWIRRSLESYISRPNRRNTDSHSSSSKESEKESPVEREGSLWREYVDWIIASTSDPLNLNKLGNLMLPKLLEVTWSTLGFQYDWTNRAYHMSSDPDVDSFGVWYQPFPTDLTEFSEEFMRKVHDCISKNLDSQISSSSKMEGGTPSNPTDVVGPVEMSLPSLSLKPEAGIVNFYKAHKRAGLDNLLLGIRQTTLTGANSASPSKIRVSGSVSEAETNLENSDATRTSSSEKGRQASTFPHKSAKVVMGGHRDDLERTFDAPVLSVSLGQPAVFLMGADSKEMKPTPLLLRSGDVVIMSGASRLAYHGVPQVFACSCAVRSESDSCTCDPFPHNLFSSDIIDSDLNINGSKEELDGETISLLTHDNTKKCIDTVTELMCYRAYMRNVRININVRQVV